MRRLFITALFVGGLWLLTREVVHVTEVEPVLITRADTAAIPEQQVPHGSSAPSSPLPSSLRPRTSASERASPPIQSQPTVISKVRVNQVADQVDEEIFIVDGETLRPAIEEVERALSLVMAQVGAAPSGLPRGMGLRISSAAGTATLDSQGFTLTDLKVAQRFGLQVGDTIVSMNGHPVNSPESAWWIFQDLFVRNHDVKELRLLIYRRGARLHRTYWITWR
jgi:membrane-associated protease RseP (regulator of RpoE activity)